MGRISKIAKPPIYFREWRKARELTQERAADRAGLSQEMLSKIERGVNAYTPETLAGLAHAYSCKVGELFEPPNPPANELARFLKALDDKGRAQALKVLKALHDDEKAA